MPCIYPKSYTEAATTYADLVKPLAHFSVLTVVEEVELAKRVAEGSDCMLLDLAKTLAPKRRGK